MENLKYKKIVFTNGCFDLLHPGHIEILKYAKSLGDYLIVALNSDESIKRLKGETRPINNQQFRKILLESLKFVDKVIIFDEDTPYNLIKQIKPDIIVKGGDYTKDQIIGKDLEDKGLLKIVIYDYDERYSTTKIIQSISNRR